MHFAYEVLQHFFGNGEVGYDAVFQGADGFDVARRTAQHAFGFKADRGDGLGAAGVATTTDGDYRGFVQDNALAAYINQRIGRAQIDR